MAGNLIMDTKNSKHSDLAPSEAHSLPIARLSGMIYNEGERGACSLVFELETEAGNKLMLPYGKLMEAIRFAQSEGVIPVLSEHWWARTGNPDGCALQNVRG